jgi:hypothetical protein
MILDKKEGKGIQMYKVVSDLLGFWVAYNGVAFLHCESAMEANEVMNFFRKWRIQ